MDAENVRAKDVNAICALTVGNGHVLPLMLPWLTGGTLCLPLGRVSIRHVNNTPPMTDAHTTIANSGGAHDPL